MIEKIRFNPILDQLGGKFLIYIDQLGRLEELIDEIYIPTKNE